MIELRRRSMAFTTRDVAYERVPTEEDGGGAHERRRGGAVDDLQGDEGVAGEVQRRLAEMAAKDHSGCATCCLGLSLTGAIFLCWIGVLLAEETLYIKVDAGVSKKELSASVFWAMGLYISTGLASIAYLFMGRHDGSSIMQARLQRSTRRLVARQRRAD